MLNRASFLKTIGAATGLHIVGDFSASPGDLPSGYQVYDESSGEVTLKRCGVDFDDTKQHCKICNR